MQHKLDQWCNVTRGGYNLDHTLRHERCLFDVSMNLNTYPLCQCSFVLLLNSYSPRAFKLLQAYFPIDKIIGKNAADLHEQYKWEANALHFRYTCKILHVQF